MTTLLSELITINDEALILAKGGSIITGDIDMISTRRLNELWSQVLTTVWELGRIEDGCNADEIEAEIDFEISHLYSIGDIDEVEYMALQSRLNQYLDNKEYE